MEQADIDKKIAEIEGRVETGWRKDNLLTLTDKKVDVMQMKEDALQLFAQLKVLRKDRDLIIHEKLNIEDELKECREEGAGGSYRVLELRIKAQIEQRTKEACKEACRQKAVKQIETDGLYLYEIEQAIDSVGGIV